MTQSPDITIDVNHFAIAKTGRGRYVLGLVVYLTPNQTRTWLTEKEADHLEVAAYAHKIILEHLA